MDSLGWFRRSLGWSGSLVSLGRSLQAVRVIRIRWVRSGAPWGSTGIFGVVGFIRVRPGGSRVHAGSLCSFGRALEVVGFIRFLGVHSGAACGASGSLGSFRRALGVVGFILVRWVHSLVSFSFLVFIRACPENRQVHSCSLCSFRCAQASLVFTRVCWIDLDVARGSSGSFGFVGFIRVRPGGPWLHSVWLGSFGRALMVFGFIRVRWVHSGAH